MAYYSNDVVVISGSFTNDAGTPTDPTDLTLIIRAHGATSGSAHEYNPGDIVKDGVGEYHLTWIVPTVQRATTYFVQWQPTGAVQRASEPDVIYAKPLLTAA